MNKLFPDEIQIIERSPTENAELDALKAQHSDWDDYYLASAAIEERRKIFEDIWEIYEPYADKDFVQQAQKNFHQRSWEMYLGSVFLDKGFTLEATGKGKPDLKIINSTPPIWVECVAPQKGDGADRVPPMQYGVVQSVPEKEMALRVSNVMKAKSEKYTKYLEEGAVGDKDVCVVAINGGELGYPDGTPPTILKVLFGVGFLTLHYNKDHTEVTRQSYSRREQVTKQSGEDVTLRFFLDDAHKHISAVIYSHKTMLNTPEDIGSECMLIHNPYAKNPLPINIFEFMQQYVVKGEEVTEVARMTNPIRNGARVNI
jgi:hypothetical protein